MNIKQIILAVTVLTATGAVFAEAPYPVEKPFVSTKTRAEVVAELTQAGDQGRVNYANSTKPVLQATASTKTRAEVQTELAAAYTNHELDPIRQNAGH